MKKRIFAIFLCLFLVSGLSFGQVKAQWVKGKFTKILKFNKQFLIKELSSAPSHTSGYGTLYVLSADGDLYFKDDAGNTTNLGTISASVATSLLDASAAVDIQTNAVYDVNFWDTIASGNPSINIYGWNTAGGDREYFTLKMNDTNDEGVIAVPNSANNEGITVKLGETNQRFRVRQNSDALLFWHTGTDAYIWTTDGQIILGTDEAAAHAAIGLTDSDGSNEFYLSATTLGADHTWFLNAHSPVKTVIIKVYADDGGLTLADGEGFFTVPIELTGMDLVSVGAHVYTASDGGTAINISIYNLTDTSDMLSTQLTIDNNEKDSSTAVAAAVIDTTEDDVVTADEIRIDINQIGANAAGLEIRLGFKLPS